jgi:hypothetical protein
VNFSWKHYQLLSALLIGALGAVSASAAGITISAASVTAMPGSSMNFFDVSLTNLGSSSITVGGFSFSLSIANPNISFTDVTTATGVSYIFSGNSLFGPDLSGPNNGQSISASDLFGTPNNGTTIASGGTVGLGHVLFNVSASAAPGVFAVTLAPFPRTTLSDALGNNINIDTLSSGQITIPGQQVAPEPSYFLPLLLLGAAFALNRIHSGRSVLPTDNSEKPMELL